MDQGNESDCSSDDIPDLESVASSEYYEESDGGAEPQDTEKLFVPTSDSYMSSENYEPAEKWLCYVKESGTIVCSMQALKALTCSPILFGGHVDASHWTEHWLPWFQETKLLNNSKGNLSTLSLDEIRIVDIIENTYEWMWKKIQANVELKYLVFIMDIWDIVKKEKVLSSAICFARNKPWFTDLLKEILCLPESLGLKDGTFRQGTHALALCCLYCCCYAGYKIREIIKSESNLSKDLNNLRFSQDEEDKRLIKSYLTQSEMAYHNLEDFEEKYIESLTLWPFNVSIHESRSMCHLGTMQQKPFISDLYRIIIVQNDHQTALLHIMRMFHDLQDSARQEMFAKKYKKCFPTTEDQIMMEKHLEGGSDKPVFHSEPTVDEMDHYQLLEDMSGKGSEDLLQENYEAALLYYKKVLKGTETKPGWHNSIPWDRLTTWMISLRFSCAWVSFKTSRYDLALDEFLTLRTANRCYPFAAAYLYSAMCYMKLKRFREATDTVKTGLQSLSIKHRRVDSLYWPGTKRVIAECNQQPVKIKLLQMRAQLLPDSDTIATCPHLSCLQHNITKQIIRDDPDFKGYTLLHCTEKCSVGYHPSCWRKYKVAHPEITSEKGFLSSPCITPDCPGIINYIAVFETADKPKFEVHLEDVKPALSQEDDSKHSQPSFAKWKKRSTHEGRKSSSSSSSTQITAPSPVQDDKTIEEKEEDCPVKTQESKPEKQEKTTLLNEEKTATLLTEDSRKAEDSVGVINRLAEEEVKEEDSSKITKKKKKKKTKGKKEPEEGQQKDNGCQWEDIFTLPQRQGLVGDSPNEERKYFMVDSDASPQTYREQFPSGSGKFPSEEHTSSQESSESSSNSNYSRRSSSLGGWSSDHEWLLSYFVEVFKEHGPMHPMDHQLVESVQILPDETQKLIDSYGGIGEFLMASPLFRTYLGGAKIGLKQDRAIIAETLETTHDSTNHVNDRSAPLQPSSSFGSDIHVSKKKEKRSMAPSWNQLPPDIAGPRKNPSLPPPEGLGVRKTMLPADLTGPKKNPLTPDNAGPRKTLLPTDNIGLRKTVLPTDNTGPRKTVLPTDNIGLTRTQSTNEGTVRKKVVDEKSACIKDTVATSPAVGSTQASGNLERAKKEIVASGGGVVSPADWKTMDRVVCKKGTPSEADGRTSASSTSSEESVSSDSSKKSVNKELRLKLCGGRGSSIGSENRSVAMDMTTKDVDNGLKNVPKRDLLDKFFVERGVNTEPLPHVESYRERYDEVLKEKKSLEDKLEVSEDGKVKMQKQHSHEMDVIEKKTKNECRKETERRIFLVEEKVREEKERASREKKDFIEQVKYYRNEMKIATEKLAKTKKEIQHKDDEKKDELLQLQKECEKLTKEKLSYEHSYQSLAEQHQRVVQRACTAEIMVINTRKEAVVKPATMKLQELEKMCTCAMQTLSGGEPELQQYKDQFKTVLDNYQNALDEQIRKIQAGTELSQLEQVAPPTAPPLNTSLRLKIQQIQRNMMLMQRKMLLQQQQQQMPSPMVPQLSLDPPALTTSLPMMEPGLSQQLTSAGFGMGPGPGLPGSGLSTGLGPGGGLADISPASGFIPGPVVGPGVGTSSVSVSSSGNTSHTSSPASVPKKTEGKNTASFDYLVSLLSPQYPNYTREDFKAIITQLRKCGSLNGLPMDVIVKRVKELIDQKENHLLLTQQHVQQQPSFHPTLSQAPSITQIPMPTSTYPPSSLPLTLTQMPLVSMPEMPPSLSQMAISAAPMTNYNPGFFLQQHQPKQMLVPPKAPPPIFSEVEYNDDNNCIICYEDMQEQNSLRLECGHRFHKNCIRSWLNEQSTCPTCRNHALLPEEFPRLQSAN